MKIVINGIQLGVVLAFLVGPIFFTILQTSIEKGFWKGALIALGVSLSDTLYVMLCYFGLVHFVESQEFKYILGYAGGGVLIVFGLYYLLYKTRRSRGEVLEPSGERKAYRYVLKGFILNLLSPAVLIFWIGTISVASVDFGYSRGLDFFLFFASVLTTVLATDILKAYLAGKLRALVTHRFLVIMNTVLGAAMAIYGIRLIFSVVGH